MDFGLASRIQSINNSNVRIFVMSFIAFFLYDTKRIEELIWGVGSQPNISYLLILFDRLASLSQHLHNISLKCFPPFLPIFHFREFCSLSFTLLAKQNLLKSMSSLQSSLLLEVHSVEYSSISIENKIAISTMR